MASEKSSGGGGRWLLILLVLGGLAGAGWWQQDRLLALLPNQDVDRWLAQAQQAGDFGRWYGESEDYANVLYQRVLQADPGNRRALAGQELVAMHLCDLAEQALADGNPGQAEMLLDRARTVTPDLNRITQIADKLSGTQTTPVSLTQRTPDVSAEQVDSLLAQAQTHMAAGRLVWPAENSALRAFDEVLEIAPQQSQALAGKAAISQQLRTDFEQALTDSEFNLADTALKQLVLVSEDAAELNDARQRLDQARSATETRQRAQRVRSERITQMLEEGRQFLARDALGEPPGENATDRFRGVLRADPGNTDARQGLARVAQRYMALTELALEEDRLDTAATMISRIEDLDPSQAGLGRAKRRLEIYREQNQLKESLTDDQRGQLANLLAQAGQALESGNLMQPPGSSAFDSFKAVQRLEPDNAEAQAGITRISETLASRARGQLSAGETQAALASFLDAEQTNPANVALPALRADLGAALRDAARVAISAGRLEDAGSWLRRASDVEANHPDLEALQLQLSIASE